MLTNAEIQELYRIYQTSLNPDRKGRLDVAITHINMFESQVGRVRAILKETVSNKQKITKMFCYTSIIYTPEDAAVK